MLNLKGLGVGSPENAEFERFGGVRSPENAGFYLEVMLCRKVKNQQLTTHTSL